MKKTISLKDLEAIKRDKGIVQRKKRPQPVEVKQEKPPEINLDQLTAVLKDGQDTAIRMNEDIKELFVALKKTLEHKPAERRKRFSFTIKRDMNGYISNVEVIEK